LKREVADAVVAYLAPIQERYQELADSPEEIEAILRQGAEKARPYAQKTLATVKERLGLG
jgi:tryptophanyl-tRNA synthetase